MRTSQPPGALGVPTSIGARQEGRGAYKDTSHGPSCTLRRGSQPPATARATRRCLPVGISRQRMQLTSLNARHIQSPWPTSALRCGGQVPPRSPTSCVGTIEPRRSMALGGL